jgi:hypothetical protein
MLCQLDKLGVTGSSPVPPTSTKALLTRRFSLLRGRSEGAQAPAWQGNGKERRSDFQPRVTVLLREALGAESEVAGRTVRTRAAVGEGPQLRAGALELALHDSTLVPSHAAISSFGTSSSSRTDAMRA